MLTSTLRRVLLLIVGLGVALASAPAAVDARASDAGSDEAVITVRVGGDRVSGAITDTGPADAAISGVPGARLGLFVAPDDPAPVPQTWAVCVSDDDGDCSFVVPDTGVGGANRDARFTVKQVSAPAGWTSNGSLRTQGTTGSTGTAYRFLTGPELRAGSTYSSLRDFMYLSADAENLGDVTASSGVWQQSRTNPPIRPGCGLDVALILDTSSSIGPALPQLIDAADSLVDALTDTRSRVAAFSFSALSPGAAAGPNHPELTSVSTPDGAAAVKAEYASWAISSGTSWDRGLFVPASAAEHYDLALVITDGNPTSYGDPQPSVRSTSATRFKEVEYGIASANALKAEGTRIITLGVGSDLGLDPMSGSTIYEGSALSAETYSLADYSAAGSALRALAAQLCQKSLSVVGRIVEIQDVDADGRLGAGDAVQYEYGVTNSGNVALGNVVVVSPLVGAVVCPKVALAPRASMICLGHAPYVVTELDQLHGSLRLASHAEGASAAGDLCASRRNEMTTAIGARVTVVTGARHDPATTSRGARR